MTSTSSALPSENTYFDMPDFLGAALKHGKSVLGFPIHEYWLDIGQHDTFKVAQDEWAQ